MLTGGGIVVLYLATYSAFGFYHLLPQQNLNALISKLHLRRAPHATADTFPVDIHLLGDRPVGWRGCS